MHLRITAIIAIIPLLYSPIFANFNQSYVAADSLTQPTPIDRELGHDVSMAALGDNLFRIIPPVVNCDDDPVIEGGIGVAFDGARILYTCQFLPKIFFTDFSGADLGFTDVFDASDGITPVSVDAIAWDPNENALWGGEVADTDAFPGNDTCVIWSINLNNGLATKRFGFTFDGCTFNFFDGITIDTVTNTIYLSPDIQRLIHHRDKAGNLLRLIDFETLTSNPDRCPNTEPNPDPNPVQGCNNSGLAIGIDGALFAGTNGEGKIVEIDPVTPAFVSDFANLGPRTEDLECGPPFRKDDGTVVQILLSRERFTGGVDVVELSPGKCIPPDFDVGTRLTKAANPSSGTAPITVTYTYTETNTGRLPITNLFINDTGFDGIAGNADDCSPVTFDADGNGIGDGGPILNIGDAFFDLTSSTVDTDGILHPGQSIRFTCTTSFNENGAFTNTAFATADVCLALDCSFLSVIHTGDPNVPGNDPNERASATVTVREKPPPPPPELPPFGDCTLRPLHEDPIDMNTVSGMKNTTPIAKTVHVEKEVYDCFLDQGHVPVIADVTIYAELYQNMDTKKMVGKQAEVITCLKLYNSKVLGCERSTPSKEPIVTQSCVENNDITHPMEMNTVISKSKSSITKTIEAQKEVFLCFPSQSLSKFLKKVDVVVFTGIYEDLDKLPNNPITKRFVQSLKCVTHLKAAPNFTATSVTSTIRVESCLFTQVSL
ncbi:MAG: hypothetical protein QXW73_01135 [Nitrososphaerales archaeon]